MTDRAFVELDSQNLDPVAK
uniref:Uncharacterized protein n=1 Tax=Arundo donax TaxID=35708 RepID=A0A0A8ZTC8_ARUDO